ncbi:uncharacterized protein KY384_007546 [Bacidia gigantensis]|uniref:uncharacterized protein n=1 Tax=Bacidia gigantensis TaxID=2732470 RepID=UPI001D04C42D|nr:uncharacterized protein KY384_007546 [Bacidia gigantensis]KAG8527394.1 hypothetical protein KY384_007546 [Bacidia gigantensis]
MAGFSDPPIAIPPEAPNYHGCAEAKYYTQYLEDYIDRHVYADKPLRSRFRFQYRVDNVEKTDDGWSVHATYAHNEQRVFQTSRLAVASGLTSIPNIPSFLSGKHDFQGPVLHHKGFATFSKSSLKSSECENVAVIGGGKSSADMIWECLKKGKHVSWIIREDGDGPALFIPAAAGGRYINSMEKGACRLGALFSSSAFMPNIWLAKFVQKTQFGMTQLRKKIQAIDQHCRNVAGYQDREGALPHFKDLEPAPSHSTFWHTGPLGMAQHHDFWPTIAQNVDVHRASITSLQSHSLTLSNGATVDAGALLLGTGWKSHQPFFSPSLAASLGLPHFARTDTPEDAKLWTSLLAAADKRVLSNMPVLAHPPPHKKADGEEMTTLRLYNAIAPLSTISDRSIVFLGRAHTSNSFRAAEAQAIWSTAYLSGHLDGKLPALEEARRRTAYMNQASRRRYPTRGREGDCFVFEIVSYTDRLVEEVGLRSHRRCQGWWGCWTRAWWRGWVDDWLEPTMNGDFRGMVEEYRRLYGIGDGVEGGEGKAKRE